MSNKGKVSFRWLGVGGIELQSEGKVLLIDPLITRPSFWKIFFGKISSDQASTKEKIGKSDFILVTHCHFDHLMDVPEIAIKKGGKVFGSNNTCEILSKFNVPTKQIKLISAGDKIELDKFKVTVLPATHVKIPGFNAGKLKPKLNPPLGLRDYKIDGCFSFLIECGGKRILNWTNHDADFTTAADVIFLIPEGNSAYYQKILSEIQPKVIFPIHWDDYFRPLDKSTAPSLKLPGLFFPPIQRNNMIKFVQMIEKIYPQGSVIIPETFVRYEL